MITGSGFATGKIILMGEHAVVYGKPAIALPFAGTTVQASIKKAAADTILSSYYQGSLAEAPFHLNNVKKLLTRLKQTFQAENFEISILSTIPAERGMGSSAAVAVAITRAFFDWQKTALSEEELLSYVNFSEKIAHGNPSGIDAAATSGVYPIYFVKGQPFQAFPLNIDAYLLVADTGIKGQTRAAVKSVAQLYEQQPETTKLHMETIGKLTEQAKTAIIQNQPEQLGFVMTQAQTALQSLGVSNQQLDDYITLSLNNGALGAKLTGGGRGGCLIVLTKDRKNAETISRLLKASGAKATWIQGLGAYQYV